MKYWKNSVRETVDRYLEEQANMYVLMQENRYHKLGMLATKTQDMGVLHDILQGLLQKKKWRVLDFLYKYDSPNQSMIQRFLLESYQQYLYQFSNENSVEVEEQQIEMMLTHILSTTEIDAALKAKFVHFFIHHASIPSIIHHASFILDTCAEESAYLTNQLLQKDWSEEMTLEVHESDLQYISYLFHTVDVRCAQLEEEKDTKEDCTKWEHVRNQLVKAVEIYIQTVVTDFHKKYPQDISHSELEQLVLKPGFPVLSILDSLPLSQSQKKNWIYRTACSIEFQTKMFLAYCKQDQTQMKLLELYYVLYQNPIPQSVLEHYSFLNISKRNAEYLEQIQQKKDSGQFNEEDIIGAIGSEEGYPIFGLFSLISYLPLDELLAIASNLVLETPEMKKELFHYLQSIKARTNQYNERAQTLDVQYVKSKIAYQNMVEE